MGNFEEVDMGQYEEEDKPYLIVDKDTGRIYDTRNENHISKITDKFTTNLQNEEPSFNQGLSTNAKESLDTSTSKASQRAWQEWWKQKRRNNQDYLTASESGDIKEVIRLLDEAIMHDLHADLNQRGLD